jgi:DHA1 family multidrug resistance protein-like MFS transporter
MTTPIRRAGLRSSWQWLLVLYTCAGFIETAFYGQIFAFTPLYLPHLGVPQSNVAAWTGWIATISSGLGIVFLPLWGALADRYARKPVIIRSFLAEMVAALLMALAPSLGIFILGRSATSMALGNSGLMMTTLTERTPRDRVGLAFSIMNGAPGVGLFLGPLLGGYMVDHYGFPTMMLLNAALLGLVVVALTLGYRDEFRATTQQPLLSMASGSVRIIWDSMRLRTLFLALFVLFAGRALASSFVPLAVAAIYNGPEPGTVVGLASAAGGVAALLLSPLLGMLADRFGHWRVLMAGAIATVFLWPLPALAGAMVGFVAAWALISGVTSGVQAISFSVLSSSAPRGVRARVMSFAYLPVVAGSTIGPALGALVSRSSVFNVFPAAAGLAAAGVLALTYAGRYQTAEPALGAHEAAEDTEG